MTCSCATWTLASRSARRTASTSPARARPRSWRSSRRVPRRFLNPQPYPVGLDAHVHTRKQQLIAEARASLGERPLGERPVGERPLGEQEAAPHA